MIGNHQINNSQDTINIYKIHFLDNFYSEHSILKLISEQKIFALHE